VLLTPPNVVSVEQVKALVDDVRRQAARPLLVVTGEESGRVSAFRKVFGATPTARELGGRTPPEVQAFAQDLGAKLKSVGVDLALAPVADLDDGPARGIIGDRSFSADPTVAGDFAMAWARGLNAAGVHPTAKHFPGHGRIREDSHSALTRLDTPLAELEATDVRPFARLIDAGVPAVLLDHVAYAAFDPDLPASLSPKAYTFLRKLGFQGVAITDSVGMGAVNLQWPFAEAAVLSIVAGADAVLATDGAQARPMRDAIVAAVRDGRLPESRLNQAAGRMEALAGGDSRALACVAVEVPKLSP
jgi:beta-N-acetylhexosaminidase